MSEQTQPILSLKTSNEKLIALLDKDIDVTAMLEQISILDSIPDVTPSDIKASQLDQTLNKLRKHENALIANATTKLIGAWKTRAKASAVALIKNATSNDSTTSSNPSSATSTTTITNTEIITQNSSSLDKSSTITATLTAQTNDNTSSIVVTTSSLTTTSTAITNNNDKNSLPSPPSPQKRKQTTPTRVYTLGVTGAPLRNMLQQKLYAALGESSSNSNNNVVLEEDYRKQLAVTIEEECFKRFGDGPDYKDRARVLLAQLHTNTNSEFIGAIVDGIYTPYDLATMTPEDMAPSEVKERMKAGLQYELDKRKTDLTGGQVGVDMFPCPKCGARETTYYQKQTRSADEPMTTFCTCVKCHKRWRIY